jgi:opacity protein-like surface antigen
MKCISIAFFCGLLLLTTTAFGQMKPGSLELSLAMNFNSLSTTTESKYNGQSYKNESDAVSAFGLDLRFGVFAAPGLSIEPEFYMLAGQGDQPAFNLGGNLAYTFKIENSPVCPFVTVGYGIGNAIPFMQRLLGRSTSDFDIAVLRAGGGLKVFVARSVALKLEYRYERYAYDHTETYYGMSASHSMTYNFHTVLIGFSVFLPEGQSQE